jgi:hypothetical protein
MECRQTIVPKRTSTLPVRPQPILYVRKSRRRSRTIKRLLGKAGFQHDLGANISKIPAPTAYTCHSRKQVIILAGVNIKPEFHLVQIVQTLDPPGFLLRLGQRRQQERRQYGDDGDDHQQFNQCERPLPRMTGKTSHVAATGRQRIHTTVSWEHPKQHTAALFASAIRQMSYITFLSLHAHHTIGNPGGIRSPFCKEVSGS